MKRINNLLSWSGISRVERAYEKTRTSLDGSSCQLLDDQENDIIGSTTKGQNNNSALPASKVALVLSCFPRHRIYCWDIRSLAHFYELK
jgi:hypothetical protein